MEQDEVGWDGIRWGVESDQPWESLGMWDDGG